MVVDFPPFPDAVPAPGARDGIACIPQPGGLRLRMWGDIDDALRAQAGAAMRQLAMYDGGVEIDVSGVSFIDSAGLAFIAQVHSLVSDHGRQAALLGPSPTMIDMLDIVGISGSPEVSGSGGWR